MSGDPQEATKTMEFTVWVPAFPVPTPLPLFGILQRKSNIICPVEEMPSLCLVWALLYYSWCGLEAVWEDDNFVAVNVCICFATEPRHTGCRRSGVSGIKMWWQTDLTAASDVFHLSYKTLCRVEHIWIYCLVGVKWIYLSVFSTRTLFLRFLYDLLWKNVELVL